MLTFNVQGGPPGQQQQFGAPPPGQYGAPPSQSAPAGPAEVGAYRQLLQPFYPPNSPIIEQIAQQAPALINQVSQRWRVPKE
jgi:hypothetical protein